MSGSKNLTADGSIATAGKAVKLFSLICRSNGTGSAVISIYTGTDNTGTLLDVVNISGASTTVRVDYRGGLTSTNGIFVDIDANTAFVTANCEQLSS